LFYLAKIDTSVSDTISHRTCSTTVGLWFFLITPIQSTGTRLCSCH